MSGAVAAGAMSGLVSPTAGEVLKQKEKQVLFIWLDGGMSQLEVGIQNPTRSLAVHSAAFPR